MDLCGVSYSLILNVFFGNLDEIFDRKMKDLMIEDSALEIIWGISLAFKLSQLIIIDASGSFA